MTSSTCIICFGWSDKFICETCRSHNPPTVAINPFVKRQTKSSSYSHWDMSDDQLLSLVRSSILEAVPGYREGVIRVPLPPEGFWSPVVKLEDGDVLCGVYHPRRKGEAARQQVAVVGKGKSPAVAVEAILYRHDVLKDDGDVTSDADFEIISINASSSKEEEPIAPWVLMTNHFGESGGTDTKMTSGTFERTLRQSYMYWRDKALVAESDKKI